MDSRDTRTQEDEEEDENDVWDFGTIRPVGGGGRGAVPGLKNLSAAQANMRYIAQSVDNNDFVDHGTAKGDRRGDGPKPPPVQSGPSRAQENSKQPHSPPVPPHVYRDSGYVTSSDTVKGLKKIDAFPPQTPRSSHQIPPPYREERIPQQPLPMQLLQHRNRQVSSSESERALQAELSKDVSWMRLAQSPPQMKDRDRTPTGYRAPMTSGPDLLADQGGLTAFPQPQLGRQTSHDVAQDQMRRQVEQQNKARKEQQQIRAVQPPPGLGSRRPQSVQMSSPPAPPSHSQLRSASSNHSLQSDRTHSIPPPPPDHQNNFRGPPDNSAEVTALGGVILPALEAALQRRAYHLQQQMRKNPNGLEKQQHAHEKIKRLVYKAAGVFKEIEEWDRVAPVGMGREVTGFLEGF